MKDAFSYMFPELFKPEYELPQNLDKADMKHIAERYADLYDPDLDKNEWFNAMKDLADEVGFAREVKEYKKNPEAFKGHVGDISSVIRAAVTGRMKSPDLHGILKALGKDEVKRRIKMFAESLA